MRILPTALLAAGFAAGASVATAQDQPLAPAEATFDMDGAPTTGYSVVLDASPSRVKDALEDFAKDEYGIDFDYESGLLGRAIGDNDLLVTDAVDSDLISGTPVKMRAQVVEEGDGSKLTVFGVDGNDTPIVPEGDTEEAFTGIENFTEAFLEDFVPSYYRSRVSATEDSIDDLREDIDDFNDRIERKRGRITDLEKDIVDLEANIADAEAKIAEKEGVLDTREEELEEAVEKVDEIDGN